MKLVTYASGDVGTDVDEGDVTIPGDPPLMTLGFNGTIDGWDDDTTGTTDDMVLILRGRDDGMSGGDEDRDDGTTVDDVDECNMSVADELMVLFLELPCPVILDETPDDDAPVDDVPETGL